MVRSRAQVTKPLKQRRDERDEAHTHNKGCDREGAEPRAGGMGARRRLSRILAKRQSFNEKVKRTLWSSPSTKAGAVACESFFSDEVERMKEGSDPIVVGQNAIQQGHSDWKCLQAAVGAQTRESVAWNILAELLKILFPKRRSTATAQARNMTQHKT